MKKALNRLPGLELVHVVDGKTIVGPHSSLSGDCTGLSGDCTGLSGDCTGLSGDCTDLRGNLGDCELTEQDRSKGVVIQDLVL